MYLKIMSLFYFYGVIISAWIGLGCILKILFIDSLNQYLDACYVPGPELGAWVMLVVWYVNNSYKIIFSVKSITIFFYNKGKHYR